MSNVSLEIGGRNFNVASADGEEEHIKALGRKIDEKLRAMGGAAGQSESRMLLFAALLLADENHDLRTRDGAPEPVEDHGPAVEKLVSGIESAAARLEKLAEHLEQAAR
jgi:cell division protein ZapA